ncbi:SARP family transcriptional regulator [Paractinoplanes abujensis]|uniref:DNA-binding SARP family transcriptional activator n=1 Tax=Paractinoplanes abujensis TaxID=882441 RepID=A0A7W7CQP8_9ACTN|nr:BTAD domain-containing putative transcriptional regulator [Actinoplanes abujensis]MBB4691550.1 DNA-binding SARP family transcriptional activator [Actinoplanes abujensis]GID17032.1 SARP family transcriptional regulator [Actinoplanes abujensis]
MTVGFGVLGPVTAWDEHGRPIALKGPRHRAVLARLIVARGRVVPIGHLVDDLWTAPPEGAVSAVRTFVAALRRALEPGRPPRTPPAVLVTEGPGYALRATDVDSWRFEQMMHEDAHRALSLWRGPAYADFATEPWAHAERSRLTELRLRTVELLADERIARGRYAEAIADLDAHVIEHPWREEAWRLLALALYRDDRQGDALAVLRSARDKLTGRLGLDPGPALARLQTDILRRADHLRPPVGPAAAAEHIWTSAAADYDRIVAAGARKRLDSTVGLLRDLAVTGGGGLEAARGHRVAAIAAAEELGDRVLTARVIGAYDVPAIWTRSDDPEQAAFIVAAAQRALPGQEGPARARLLATIALETRGGDGDAHRATTNAHGDAHAYGWECAQQAVAIARGLDDPGLLAFALNGLFMQSCRRCGLAPERDATGAELVGLAARHGLTTYEVLGHLIRMQARAGVGDLAGADEHAEAADRLADGHELPLVAVFTTWYRAMREPSEAAYRAAATTLDGAGMPGLADGLLPLALLCLGVVTDESFGPYEPWARPHLLLAAGDRAGAREALRAVPDPPADLLSEALWALVVRAARSLDDRSLLGRARKALEPARGQIAGAGSGVLSAGPVDDYL